MRPIFEIIDGDNHYKIFENGTIDGFPVDIQVINRIPIVLAERISKWCAEAEEKWNGSSG